MVVEVELVGGALCGNLVEVEDGETDYVSTRILRDADEKALFHENGLLQTMKGRYVNTWRVSKGRNLYQWQGWE